MHLLGISGSPRRKSNSEALLNASLEPFEEAGWEIQRFLLCERQVGMCTGCETCQETGSCVLSDDMEELYRCFQSCDAVVISAPVYWRNVPAQLKAVFDRTYAAGKMRPLAGKPGGAIAVGRGTGGGQALVLSIIINYFLSCGALCVPGELNGVSAQADKPGDILLQPRRLMQAQILGENVLRIANRLVD